MSIAINRTRNDLIDRYHAAPSTPKTPLVERSISATFSSPGSYGRENEEILVYQLDSRAFKAGWAGESTPRCIWRFGYAVNENTRTGDYSHLIPGRKRTTVKDHVLYQADLRNADLSLIYAKLERVIRAVHLDHLQLNLKSAAKKAALVISPLTPTKILEIALGVLFNHHSQPPSATLLTTPAMICVGAGLRQGLVIYIDWEETMVSAVSEYRNVAERRTIRGGKLLHDTIAKLLRSEMSGHAPHSIDFTAVEQIKDRLAWCATENTPAEVGSKLLQIPLSHDTQKSISFGSLSESVHSTFFAPESAPSPSGVPDDNDISLPELAYRVLRDLPRDTRGACAQRIVVDGPQSHIPGLRQSILQRIQSLIDSRGWANVITSNGQNQVPTSRPSSSDNDDNDHFATPRAGSPNDTRDQQRQVLSDYGSNGTGHLEQGGSSSSQTAVRANDLYEGMDSPQDAAEEAAAAQRLPAGLRAQDDVKDHVTQKAERESKKRQVTPFSGTVRGIESLGAWSGASMAMNLRVKGVCEVDREDFMKHGFRDSVSLLI